MNSDANKKKSNRFSLKVFWYIVLLCAGTAYVVLNRKAIYQLDKMNAVNVIFIVWLVVLILPLFSEIELFGIKLKKEVEKVKEDVSDSKKEIKDVKDQLIDLKISNSVSAVVNVAMQPLPPAESLSGYSRSYSPGAVRTASAEEQGEGILGISFQSAVLSQIKTGFEKNLSEICRMSGAAEGTAADMLAGLKNRELIDSSELSLLSLVFQIALRGFYGEEIREEYFIFVRDALPEVNQLFQNAKEKLSR